MQTRELIRATIRVANTTNISGRATAGEINRGLRTGKERSFWRIASLTFLGFLTVAGLLVALEPLPARADNDEDSRHGREDNDKGIRAEITALQAQVASLQSTFSALQGEVSALQKANTGLQNEVNNLQTSNAKLQNQVNGLQTSNTTLQSQLTAVKSNHALLLGPFVSVVSGLVDGVNGPHIYFTGANIHIVSGSGSTFDNFNVTGNFTPTGLGNLIIGYNEDPVVRGGFPLAPGDRSGSHNLVIGTGNRFTKAALGGLVAGSNNTISNLETSVSGGALNTASGGGASVSGGASNTASGFQASVSGGQGNTASGHWESILGGFDNLASGNFASVVGGENNTASGDNAVVLGGQNVTNNKDLSIAPQPPFP